MLLSSSSRQAMMRPFAPTRRVLAAPARAGDRIGKADLVENVVAAVPGITKKDAGAAVDAVFDGIAAALAAGGEASIVGFGSFKVGERAAREGRNPRTGESIPIAASKAPKFSAGKALKDRVNGEDGGGGGGAKKAPAGAGRKTTTARAPTASATAGRKTAARRSTKSK
jgi:DNA-binding protein HU-beta